MLSSRFSFKSVQRKIIFWKFNSILSKFFSNSNNTILLKKELSKKSNLQNILIQSSTHNNNNHLHKDLFSKEFENLRSGKPIILKEKEKIKLFIDELNIESNSNKLKDEPYFSIESILYFLIQNKVKNPKIINMYIDKISKENLSALKLNDLRNKFNSFKKIIEDTILQPLHINIYKSF